MENTNKNENDLFYQIALTMIPDVGNVLARSLVAYCGGVKAVFETPKKKLVKIPGIGPKIAHAIHQKDYFVLAEKELKFIEDKQIKTYFYLEKDYPFRLKELADSPILLYQRGNTDLNPRRALSVVGTRKPSNYGKDLTAKLIEELTAYNVLIVSGMAFGIDIIAHKAAMSNSLRTIGVMAHGLDTVHPRLHQNVATQMMNGQDSLISEFHSYSHTLNENFPRRNRIIAGISDATLVVQTDVKGGSMITAHQAHAYKRKLLAIPGRVGEKSSAGCNLLIKTQKATLVESGAEIAELLGWDVQVNNAPKQRSLFVEYTEQEQKLVDLFQEKNNLHIDFLLQKGGFKYSELAAILLTLEMKGIIKSQPGSVIKFLG